MPEERLLPHFQRNHMVVLPTIFTQNRLTRTTSCGALLAIRFQNLLLAPIQQASGSIFPRAGSLDAPLLPDARLIPGTVWGVLIELASCR